MGDPAISSAAPTDKAGCLTIVGTGIRQSPLTKEITAHIINCDKFLYLVADRITELHLLYLRPDAVSLHSFYVEGKDRLHCYQRMAEALVTSVDNGHSVCAAFYGHPGVYLHTKP